MLHLRELREKRGLSQADIARALGISRQSYNFYENGKRDPDTNMLKSLADFFGVTSDYIIGRKNPDSSMNDEEKAAFYIASEPDFKEIMDLYQKLPTDKKDLVLAMARAMVKD